MKSSVSGFLSEGRKYMTLNQLLYVVEVSKTKSINATAHTLFVTQSCVSTAIRELEDELGIIIFNRTNRGITITKDGEAFIYYLSNDRDGMAEKMIKFIM
ncbi:MAG: LysR family transcriptional regulator [Lachnospiraceae bacterium]|nr:LysR family transcriptional regulator [Lachnospiraceae bacterium]